MRIALLFLCLSTSLFAQGFGQLPAFRAAGVIKPASGGGGVTTPTLVQWMDGCEMDNTGQSVASSGKITCFLPNPTQSSNCIILFFRTDATSITGVTDDKGNTWTKATNSPSRMNAIYYTTNCAASTRRIFVQVGSTTTLFTYWAGEFAGIALSAALDKAAATGNETQHGPGGITSGSMTPSVSGDMIIQFISNSSPFERPTNYVVGTAGSPNITWQLCDSDMYDTVGAAWGIYSSTSAINPSITIGGSAPQHMDSVAAAFKAATGAGAGNLATGMRIVGIQCNTVEFGDTTGQTNQYPVSGNLHVVACSSGDEDLSTVPTDSESASWYATGARTGAGLNAVRFYYRTNAPSNNSLRVIYTLDGTPSDLGVYLIDIAGANSFPFSGGTDDVLTNGNETGTGNNTMLSIVPSTASGLAFGVNSIDFNTVTNVNSPWLQLSGFLPVNNAGNTPYFENNGFAVYPVSSTNSTALTWTFQSGLGANVGNWSCRAVFFKQ